MATEGEDKAPDPQAGAPDPVQQARAAGARAQAMGQAAKAKREQARAAREQLRLEAEQAKREAEKAGKPIPLPPNVADVEPSVLERVRLAIQTLERQGASLSVAAVRKAAACDQWVAADVVGAVKAGLMPPTSAPWVAGHGPTGRVLPQGRAQEELIKRLRTARSPADLAKVSQEVAAFVAQGRLDAGTARSIVDACKEARQGMEAQAKRPPSTDNPDDRTMALVSPEALECAKAVDHLSDDRRAMVFGYVADLAEQEAEEAARLQAEGGSSGAGA